MRYISDQRSTTKGKQIQTVSRYQARNCAGCPLNGACHKAKGDRINEVDHRPKHENGCCAVTGAIVGFKQWPGTLSGHCIVPTQQRMKIGP